MTGQEELPVGVDFSWELPSTLRPRTEDLPALAWLAARRTTPTPRQRTVGWFPALCMVPTMLLALVAHHATATLAARGRAALVLVTPMWAPARRQYRLLRSYVTLAVALAGTVSAALLGYGMAFALLELAGAAGVDPVWLLDVLQVAFWLVLLGFVAGFLAHPWTRAIPAQFAHRRNDPPADGRTALVTSLVGRGRPSVAAARLGLDLVRHADVRGWHLLTNAGVSDYTGGQYARAGFVELPGRRMLRRAADRGRLSDVVAQHAAQLSRRTGVRVDEVNVTDGTGAESERYRGRNHIGLPVEHLLPGYLSLAGRTAFAHELGHHHLDHFTTRRRWARVGPRIATLLAAAGLTGAAMYHWGLLLGELGGDAPGPGRVAAVVVVRGLDAAGRARR